MIPSSGRLTPERLNRIFSDLLNHRYVGVLSAEDEDAAKEFYFAGSGLKLTSVGPRKSLPVGRFWVSDGVLTEEVLAKALDVQKDRGGLVGEILTESGDFPEEPMMAGLTAQVTEELCDLFFWPGPKYRYKPGPQTRVGGIDRRREREGAKSLTLKGNLAQIIMQARVDGKNLRDAGRKIGGVETTYRGSPEARKVLFTREAFMAYPPPERKLLALFNKPRSAGEIIEEADLPWSRVLLGMAKFLKEGLLEPAS